MMTANSVDNFVIDFERLHSAVETINLLDCQGTVVKVSGLAVESNGPMVGLGGNWNAMMSPLCYGLVHRDERFGEVRVDVAHHQYARVRFKPLLALRHSRRN